MNSSATGSPTPMLIIFCINARGSGRSGAAASPASSANMRSRSSPSSAGGMSLCCPENGERT